MESSNTQDIPSQSSEQAKTDNEKPTLMPSFFICHGSPALMIEKNQYVTFLKKFHKSIPTPKAIVVFSAHNESSIQTIGKVNKYDTIYDFYGFPQEMYKITYEAKGDLALADEIKRLLDKNNIKNKLDEKRGLDHGVWSPLHHMYPEKNIPIIPLSVDPDLAPEEIYKIGAALAPLREKGVLIIGSGSTVHNLGKLDRSGADGSRMPWAAEFEDWILKNVDEWNTTELFDYMKKGPNARASVPTTEHFIPLLYAMGTGDANKKPTLIHKWMQYGSLTMSAIRFD